MVFFREMEVLTVRLHGNTPISCPKLSHHSWQVEPASKAGESLGCACQGSPLIALYIVGARSDGLLHVEGYASPQVEGECAGPARAEQRIEAFPVLVGCDRL